MGKIVFSMGCKIAIQNNKKKRWQENWIATVMANNWRINKSALILIHSMESDIFAIFSLEKWNSAFKKDEMSNILTNVSK